MKKNNYFILLCFVFVFGCAKKEDAQPVNIDKNKLLQLVNNLRQAGCVCGSTTMPSVPIVTWDNILEKASQDHSKDMNQKNYFSHTSQDGRNAGQRITAAGYTWATYGENIAKGQSNEEAVIESWKNSEGHCKNIMNANVREMGVGKSGEYWTQIFAKK
ncbi:MAG: CAP domain-containing protein [Cytophagia bacterium]|nr:MAG: CAP domain-containing protein [Cytophagia bacterium]